MSCICRRCLFEIMEQLINCVFIVCHSMFSGSFLYGLFHGRDFKNNFGGYFYG
jgi:hypothetical protein